VKILIVEDNREQREILRDWLSARHHECRAFACAAMAIAEVYSGWMPDAVVLDVVLPVLLPDCLDAQGLVRRLRAVPGGANVVVVITTGYRDAKIEGATAVLTKPFDPAELEALLVELTDRAVAR
jgi:CheY-like chemotaxis protein